MKNKYKIASLMLLIILVLPLITYTCDDNYSILYRDWRKCFNPEFKPGSGSYKNEAYITLSCKSDGATIYYTLDGTNPDTTSSIYSDPVHITDIENTTVITAYAVRDDLFDSDISSARYNITYDPDKVLPPQFNPPGGTYDSVQSVEITCQTDGAIIYYTTDGIDPTIESSIYSDQITISENNTETVIKALAVKEDMVNSVITSAAYILNIAGVDTPVFSIDPGSYPDDQTLEISCSTENAVIYYTIDGSDPLTSGTEYTGSISLTNPSRPTDETTYSVRAVATADGLDNSSEAAGTFTITGTVDAPAFAPTSSQAWTLHDTPVDITISTTTNGASIRYTTDLSTPTSSNGTPETSYSLCGKRLTFKAIAYKDGWNDSLVAQKTYVSYMVLDSDTTGSYKPQIAYSHLGYYGFVYRKHNGTTYRVYYNRVDENGDMLSSPIDIFTASGYNASSIDIPAIAYYQKDAATGYFGVAAIADGTIILFQAINPSDGSLVGTLLSSDLMTTCNNVSVISSAPCADFSVYFINSNVSKDAMLGKVNEPFNAWVQTPISILDASYMDTAKIAYNPVNNEYGQAYCRPITLTTRYFTRNLCNLSSVSNSTIVINDSTGLTELDLIFDAANQQYIYAWNISTAHIELLSIPWDHTITSSPLSSSTTIDAADGTDDGASIALADNFYGIIWHYTPSAGNDSIYYSYINTDASIDSSYINFDLMTDGLSNLNYLDLAYGNDEFALVFEYQYSGSDYVHFMTFNTRPE